MPEAAPLGENIRLKERCWAQIRKKEKARKRAKEKTKTKKNRKKRRLKVKGLSQEKQWQEVTVAKDLRHQRFANGGARTCECENKEGKALRGRRQSEAVKKFHS